MTHLTQFRYQNYKWIIFFSHQQKKITLEPLKQYQNFDPVIRKLTSWHKYKTKTAKADTTILGNNFRKQFKEI